MVSETYQLMKKKQKMEGKEIPDMFMNSDKSLDVILVFMSGNSENYA